MRRTDGTGRGRDWRMAFMALVSSVLLGACASAPDSFAPYEGDSIDSPKTLDRAGMSTDAADAGGGSNDAGRCVAPATGCPCAVDQDIAECGRVYQKFGDYTRCAPSYRICRGGAWTECSSDRIAGGP